MNYKAIILAGGVGTRLWPLSRQSSPKQVKALLNDRSILQNCYATVRRAFAAKDIYVVTTADLADNIKQQLKLPVRQLIIEPFRRETAAAIGLAAWLIEEQSPGATIVTINSDNYFGDANEFSRVIKLAGRLSRQQPEYLLTIGINPTYPETGYGYIKMGEEFQKIGKDRLFNVASFKEKPNLQLAKKYLDDWRYLWNAALFCFQARSLKTWYGRFLPGHFKAFEKLLRSKKTRRPAVLKQVYASLKPTSIDFGLLEKLDKMLVLPGSFQWHDIGHWKTLAAILPADKAGNIVKGKFIGLDSQGNLIYGTPKKLIAAIGLENYIIVDTEDALLICHQDKAQEVKRLVQEIKAKKWHGYLK